MVKCCGPGELGGFGDALFKFSPRQHGLNRGILVAAEFFGFDQRTNSKLFNFHCRVPSYFGNRSFLTEGLNRSKDNSNAALTLDHQNACFSARMGDMLASHFSEKHVANRKCDDMLDAGLAVMHIDRAVEDDKDFYTIVDMPPVRLVGPVETDRSSPHVGDVVSTPSARGGEIFAPNNSHRSSLLAGAEGTQSYCIWRAVAAAILAPRTRSTRCKLMPMPAEMPAELTTRPVSTKGTSSLTSS